MVYAKNLPNWERIVRLVASAAMAGCAYAPWGHPAGVIFAVLAVYDTFTALFGFCPARSHHSIDDLPRGMDIAHDAVAAEPSAVVSSIIAALPAPYREVLVLKDIQGLTAEEFGVMLSISPEAAGSRLLGGRAMVRGALSDAPSMTGGAR